MTKPHNKISLDLLFRDMLKTKLKKSLKSIRDDWGVWMKGVVLLRNLEEFSSNYCFHTEHKQLTHPWYN